MGDESEHSPSANAHADHAPDRPQACAVADWLLSQEVKRTSWPTGRQDPKEPEHRDAGGAGPRLPAKAPGMTAAKADEVLPEDAADLDKVPGYSEDGPAVHRPRRRRAFPGKGPITTDKLKWYIGKKSISRLGCYGCHDLPGFETAKPIGTALNDWGKKDPERLAFEDADAYVRDHYNIVKSRDAAADKHQPDPDWHSKDGKEPYEKAFYEALEHHTREGFLHQKLTEPRSYDYNRIRAWDDRLRMPQFRFARSRPRAGETDEAYDVRQEREEARGARGRDDVHPRPGGGADPAKVRRHARPRPAGGGAGPARCWRSSTASAAIRCGRASTTSSRARRRWPRWSRPTRTTTTNDAKKDHVFPGHNAWTGVPSPWPDRLDGLRHAGASPARRGHGARHAEPAADRRDALHQQRQDHRATCRPACRLTAPPEDVIDQSPPFGGAFADLLMPDTWRRADSTLFRRQAGRGAVGAAAAADPRGRTGAAEMAVPVPAQSGARSAAGEDAAADAEVQHEPRGRHGARQLLRGGRQAEQPGAGLTTPYLTDRADRRQVLARRNKEYSERLKAVGGPDGKGLDQRAKDLLTRPEGRRPAAASTRSTPPR